MRVSRLGVPIIPLAFLAIESTKAKLEITRLLKEELLKLQTSGIHHINKGRYKVL